MNTPSRRGITLIDLLMSIVVIGIVVASAAPALSPDEHLRLQSASIVLTADLEYAQSATIAEPADPTVVRLRDDGLGYWLARASDPDLPIEVPNSGGLAYEVEYGVGRAAQFDGVSIVLTPDDPTTITFDAFGRLEGVDDAEVRLSNLSGELVVRTSATTGSVFIENAE